MPKTPYQMLMESEQISEEAKEELQSVYLSLNPAELKRAIEERLNNLFKAYAQKGAKAEPCPSKKQTPRIDEKSYILNDSTTPSSVT